MSFDIANDPKNNERTVATVVQLSLEEKII